MIQVKVREPEYPTYVQIAYPGESKKPVYKYVINQKEASVVTHLGYRDYIFEKLDNWLTQRAYGLQIIDPHRAQMARQLQAVLGIFKLGTLRNICINVHSHRDNYEYLAPPEKSEKMYKHYINRIVPVLNFCAEMGGDE